MKEFFKYKYDDLFNPTLEALHKLGGSGSIIEIEEQVINILTLSECEGELHLLKKKWEKKREKVQKKEKKEVFEFTEA